MTENPQTLSIQYEDDSAMMMCWLLDVETEVEVEERSTNGRFVGEMKPRGHTGWRGGAARVLVSLEGYEVVSTLGAWMSLWEAK